MQKNSQLNEVARRGYLWYASTTVFLIDINVFFFAGEHGMLATKRSKKQRYYERFQQLVRVLETVRDEHKPFDISQWVELGSGKIPCQTAACAAGWAARDVWFNKQGFTLYVIPYYAAIFYCRHVGWDALHVFFGISKEKAMWLFSKEGYAGDLWQEGPHVEDVLLRVHAYMRKRFGGLEASA